MLIRRNTAWWKRYLAGMAGGAAGTAAMGLFMKAMQKASTNGSNGAEKKTHDISLIGRRHQEDEQATAALGRIIYSKVKGRDPDPAVKAKTAQAVHWTYGIEQGATYGLIRGRKAKGDILGGLAFGAALWLAGDMIAVPLLGLSEGPKAFPKSLHAEALGAHLVYGVATAAATQLVERVI